jgi:hypothetical protein
MCAYDTALLSYTIIHTRRVRKTGNLGTYTINHLTANVSYASHTSSFLTANAAVIEVRRKSQQQSSTKYTHSTADTKSQRCIRRPRYCTSPTTVRGRRICCWPYIAARARRYNAKIHQSNSSHIRDHAITAQRNQKSNLQINDASPTAVTGAMPFVTSSAGIDSCAMTPKYV